MVPRFHPLCLSWEEEVCAFENIGAGFAWLQPREVVKCGYGVIPLQELISAKGGIVKASCHHALPIDSSWDC